VLIEQIHLTEGKHQEQINAKIELKPFIDLYFDTMGWYALAHHQPEKFLAAVFERDRHAKFSIEDVEWKWMIQQSNGIKIIDSPIFNSQPVTLVEDWGGCECDDCLD